jgi:hypothetical protein
VEYPQLITQSVCEEMNENQPTENKAPLRNVSRRVFLPGLIVGIFGLNAFVIKFFIPKAAPLPDPHPKSPRFPKRNVEFTKLELSPGFYRNPNTAVIHYLSGGPTRLFKVEAQKYLTLINPTGTAINSVGHRIGRPRVDLGRSSYYFEQAAAAEIKNKQIDAACDLLLYAIRLETQSVYRADRMRYFRPFKKAPSFRLYDLLAGVSVRFKTPHMAGMIALLKNSNDPKLRQSFDSRIEKWENSKSKWHLRWSNKNDPIEWTVIKGLDLLM